MNNIVKIHQPYVMHKWLQGKKTRRTNRSFDVEQAPAVSHHYRYHGDNNNCYNNNYYNNSIISITSIVSLLHNFGEEFLEYVDIDFFVTLCSAIMLNILFDFTFL